VSPAEVKNALLTAAVKMKKTAPHEWGVFIQALSAQAEIENQNLLGADAGHILHAQGRALAMQDLCISLADAEQSLIRVSKDQRRAMNGGI
jgi:hypothetical protein